MEGLTFVEKEFYANPPRQGATHKEWMRWIKRDNYLRKRAASRFYSHPRKMKRLPEFDRAFNIVKVDGGWRQRLSMNPLIETQQAETLRQYAKSLAEKAE